MLGGDSAPGILDHHRNIRAHAFSRQQLVHHFARSRGVDSLGSVKGTGDGAALLGRNGVSESGGVDRFEGEHTRHDIVHICNAVARE